MNTKKIIYVKSLDKGCPMCGKVSSLRLTAEEYEAWGSYVSYGGLIQDKLPDMNPFEREFIKTGYCLKCQHLLFNRKAPKKGLRWYDADDIREEAVLRMEELYGLCRQPKEQQVSVLTEMFNKLSIPEKVVALNILCLEGDFYIDEDGALQERADV